MYGLFFAAFLAQAQLHVSTDVYYFSPHAVDDYASGDSDAKQYFTNTNRSYSWTFIQNH